MRFVSRLLSSLMVATLVLSGCSASKKSADTPKPSDTAAVDPNKPVSGGTFVRAVNYGDPGSLDPIAKADTSARMIVMQIFDTLVRYDPVKKVFVKSAAEDYNVSQDGKTYTFKLRKGMTFTNGREVKAADVKYSLERASNPKTSSVVQNLLDAVVGADAFKKGTASEITGIAAKDDYDLVITLTDPSPTFLFNLSNPGLSIVPKEEVEKAGADFGQKPVGSGPFKLKEWQKDDHITLDANDKYWKGRPYLDGVTFRFMGEEQTRDAEFQAGTIDAQVLGEALYKKYAADPERSKLMVEVPELYTRAIMFNTEKPPFNDVRVRQAINYAINKQPIIDKVLSGKAFPATGVLPASSDAFNKDLKGYEYNPDKAKQLLKEAGYEKGFQFDVLTSEATTPSMEAINQDLNKIGVNAKITQLDLGTLLGRSAKGDFSGAVFFSAGGVPDAMEFLMGCFWSKSIGTVGQGARYHNDRVDALIEQASKTVDDAARVKLLQDAEQLIVADAPWFAFNYNKAVMIAQPWVHGLQSVPTDIDFQDLTQVWLSKKK